MPAAAAAASALAALAALHVAAAVTLVSFAPVSGVDVALGWQCREAMRQAVAAVNADASVLPGATVQLLEVDTQGQLGAAASGAFDVAQGSPVAAFVGSALSLASEGVGIASRVLNVPQVSYGATAAFLDDARNFPYFSRVLPSSVMFAEGVMEVLKQLKWRHVAVLTSADDDTSFVGAFEDAARVHGVLLEAVVQHRSPVAAGAAVANASVSDGLAAVAASPARVVVMVNAHVDAQFVLARAAELGMLGGEYVWVGSEHWFDAVLFAPTTTCDAACVASFRSSLVGALGVRAAPDAAAFAAWQTNVWAPAVTRLTAAQQTGSGQPSWTDENLEPITAFAYDAVLLACQGLHDACGPAATACPFPQQSEAWCVVFFGCLFCVLYTHLPFLRPCCRVSRPRPTPFVLSGRPTSRQQYGRRLCQAPPPPRRCA